MINLSIKKLLNGTYVNPDDTGFLKIGIKQIVIERSLETQELELIKELNLGKKLGLVFDSNTFEVLGKRIDHSLSNSFNLKKIGLPINIDANITLIDQLLYEFNDVDAVIAVGSGTINDLCKFATFKLNKPYVIFGTSPSVNGYCSMNASITDGHIKKSFKAHLPTAVFLDLTVLSSAPVKMIQAGLGDSICRSTAQTDWLLSHILLETPYKKAPFNLLSEDENYLFENSAKLLEKDMNVMAALARTLILSGCGMTLCGGSYPASQGEHLLSHYMEWYHKDKKMNLLHGEQIAVTTLTMARLQHKILSLSTLPLLDEPTVNKEQIIDHFGPEIGEDFWDEYATKIAYFLHKDKINKILKNSWNDIKKEILNISLPPHTLEQTLLNINAPTTIQHVGWSKDSYKNALFYAKTMRNRYTFLDFVADTNNTSFLQSLSH
ncbi:MAG: iron-containing alcohol dehydrogenase [Alphaproteobacteria bacterium]|nr:iron-containing alcohol dehydrogenase [Alphaproteobacteria bacterium]